MLLIIWSLQVAAQVQLQVAVTEFQVVAEAEDLDSLQILQLILNQEILLHH